ncbi:MAG TPA: helix-turn-helix domain-containing protein [Bacteroidia bacterium]|jgi:DNA-binding HxlR family transcriptional regulator|nr:helix-turn-helix domain-containing protein [Bacteroidia bacterium]
MVKADKKHIGKRSGCPLSCSLDLVGDKWSLLIIRDMLLFGKSTYNEFLESQEGISTNILSDRLVKLTEDGLITFSGTAKRKKYALTKMGLDVKPILESIGMFGTKYFKGSKAYLREQMKEFSDK